MLDYLAPAPDYQDLAVASAMDELSFWAAPFGQMLLEQIDLVPNIRILDLACGTGFPLIELAQVYGRSCQVVGLDLWAAGLARAAAKARGYGLSNVALVHGDGA